MCEYGQLFKAVRQALYDSFPVRADALFNLLDSLSGRQTAPSVVELSLEPLCERGYSSLFDAVDGYFEAADKHKAIEERRDQGLRRLKIIWPTLPKPTARPFWLTGLDATSALRPYADKLSDRGVTYSPNPAPGNKPIGVGHSYSLLALLPEREPHAPPWVVPLSCERIPTVHTANEVAAAQMRALLGAPELPLGHELTVNVADSSYSKAYYLEPVGQFAHHVEVVRVARNRKFFRMVPRHQMPPGQRGRPKCFGQVFALGNEATWGSPDDTVTMTMETRSGRPLRIEPQRWYDLLMRGKRGAPMHERLFDLLRCQVFDPAGQRVFQHALWLIVMGPRRREIGTAAAYAAYRQRYDLEIYQPYNLHKTHSVIILWLRAIVRYWLRHALTAIFPIRPRWPGLATRDATAG